MRILSHLKIGTKLTLLLGMSALALVASIGVAASLMHQRMFDDRVDKLRAVAQSAISIAQTLESQVLAHTLTREQALALLRDGIHAIRFDGGGGYLVAQTLDNMVVAHGVVPALDGKPSPATDASGKPLTDLIRDALHNADEGVVSYTFPKRGQAERQPKLAYVARFAPWDLVFISGAYVDDFDAAFRATLVRLARLRGFALQKARFSNGCSPIGSCYSTQMFCRHS